MKILQKGGLFIRGLAAAAAIMAVAPIAKGVPFASCVTNTGGTISFYLNEAGGNVTVKYGDGSTDGNYNGTSTGTNLAAGVHSFTVPGTNTTYTISVQKNGSGTPSMIASVATTNPRGVDADKVATSPYFGRVYFVDGAVGVNLLNSDLSVVQANATAGLTWGPSGSGLDSGNGTGHSPDWVTVDPGGSGNVYVTGSSSNGSCIWQVPGNFASNQQVLANIGSTPTPGSSTIYSNHGTLAARCIITGSLASNNLTLYTIDGNGPAGWAGPISPPAGAVYTYHIGSGPLPWPYPPDNTNSSPVQVAVPGVSINLVSGNFYPGFTQGPPPNNYIYGSTYRATNSWNYLTIMDSTGTNVIWSSGGLGGYPLVGTPPNGDWFQLNRPDGGSMSSGFFAGTSAVSPDGNYVVLMSIYNYFVIAPLTNGIPNTSAIFTVAPTSYGVNGRGICWDAADNIIMSSSGIGVAQSWSLGITATAVTSGNLSGTTGFTLAQPSTTVSVVAVTNFASQNTAPNGTGAGPAIPGAFSVNRVSTSGYGSPQTVNYVLGGTATTAGGVYTVSGGTTNSAVIPAGQTNTFVTITPSTANVPRLTTTVTLSLAGGAGYSVAAPFSDTVFIQNTSSQQIQLSGAATNMYRGYSNDFASFTVTRLGDTNAPQYTVNTFGPVAGGTAIQGTDYTAPTNVVFNPGDISQTDIIMPLIAGAPPVRVANPTYVGNLTAIMGATAGTGYTAATNTVVLTSIDPGNPPATVLFSDPLDSSTAVSDLNTWTIAFGSADWDLPDTNDYEVDFGYDITDPGNQANAGLLTNPPSGANQVLRITCNKSGIIKTNGSPGVNSGVNVYVTGQNFSGNYAARFNMLLVQGSAGGFATEGSLFGINHGKLGVATNWWTGGTLWDTTSFPNGWTADGVWWWIDGDAGGASAGDFLGFAGSNSFPNGGWKGPVASTYPAFEGAFKSPVPFSTAGSLGGIPASETSFNTGNTPAGPWADVEIKQINNQVTLSINKTLIQTYNNSTNIWTNGTVMFGFDDPFDSVQNEDGAVYFSNLRVVRIGPPSITQVTDTAGTVTLRFVTQDGDDTTSSFTLLSSGAAGTALNVDTTVAGATFTQLGTGAFQVTTPTPATKAVFYRIKHN